MKTLDEYNKHQHELRRKFYENQHLAGVLCPECKTELHYKGIGINCSNPPSRWVICPNCEYTGLKY